MKEQFISRAFRRDTLRVIEHATTIIEEYQLQGFSLTLRQLYYQFVSRALIPNSQSEYKKLGSIINDARLAGLIDWDAIEDRTRNLRALPTWSGPQSIINAVCQQFRTDVWSDQPSRVEVWIEKDALVGVIERVCNNYRVPFFACRGYSSQSEQYAAGKRFAEYAYHGQSTIILHLGDHDPSGIDMTRDNRDRLNMFSGNDAPVEVRRLALNMAQVREHNPPPNPAKEEDSRAADYIEKFGRSSWELDALDPRMIEELIGAELASIINRPLWDAAMVDELGQRSTLEAVSARWDDVAEFISDQ
jgi:hypothetical protein